MSARNDKTCGTCRHWHRQGADPRNLNHVQGECRHSPPGITFSPQGILATYPHLPPQFPACARHEPEAIVT